MNKSIQPIVGGLTVCLAVSATAQDFRTFTSVSGAYDVTPNDVGSVISSIGATIIRLPSPSTLPTGVIGIRKGDNSSQVLTIQRTDAGTIGGWATLTLVLQGDYCHIANTGTEYFAIACGQIMPGASQQHRTPLRSMYPFYYLHASERNAFIRYVFDINENGNVVLPSKADIGSPGGYRGGFSITIMPVRLPVGKFLAVHANGTSIHGHGQYLLLIDDLRVVQMDFDGNEWFITSGYSPSSDTFAN